MFTIIPIMGSDDKALPTVATDSVLFITSSSAIEGGDVTDDGGATVTERGIVYSLTSVNSNPTIGGVGVVKNTNGSGTGSFSETISGLSSLSGYSVRAYATNSVGTAYGTIRTFTTLPSISVTSFSMTQGDYSSSGAACLGHISGDTGTFYHDGSGTYPVASDKIYSDQGATLFNGGNFWYYVDGNGTAIQINGSGVVTLASICA